MSKRWRGVSTSAPFPPSPYSSTVGKWPGNPAPWMPPAWNAGCALPPENLIAVLSSAAGGLSAAHQPGAAFRSSGRAVLKQRLAAPIVFILVLGSPVRVALRIPPGLLAAVVP